MVLFLSFGLKTFGSHVYGGNITYTHLGGDQYQIDVSLYFECTSAGEGSVNIWAYSVLEGTPRLITAAQNYSGLVDTIYPFNPCYQSPAGTCLRKQTYQTTTTLESGLGGFSLHIEVFNRSANVNNLTNPASYGAIFYCNVPDPLDLIAGGYNNGPYFVNDPPPNLCITDTIRFDHSVIEPDGDSIAYKFCDPKGRIGIAGTGPEFIARPFPNVPWAAGYNTNDQLPSAIPFTINPTTGLLEGIPNALGFYVYSVCFEEYRNGILINEGNRDYMFEITNCNPNIAIADFAIRLADQYSVLFPATRLAVFRFLFVPVP